MNEKQKVAILSVFSNSFLTLSKLICGIVIGSISVISEAIHSSIDLLASIIAYISVKTSSKPPDDEHKFGHEKIENISGFIEAILIFLAAGWIIYESIEKMINPYAIEKIGIGIFIMFFSSAVNFFVSKKLMKIAIKTNSIALKADAIHLTTDIYTSFGVMFGLIIIWLLELIFKKHHFHWIDPIFAILVAILIIKVAWKLTFESFHDLIDSSMAENDIKKIEDIINSTKDVKGFKNLKTRKAGNKKFIEFDLLFDENISLKNAHNVADNTTEKIIKEIEGSQIIIHMEPFQDEKNK